MGKVLKGIGYGVAGLAAVGGSFVAGRETAPETGNETNIEELIQGYNDACAQVVLEAAGAEFVIVRNDPKTAADEQYDSSKAIEDKSQDFIKREMDACVAKQLPNGLEGYEVRYPVFEPQIEEGN